MKRLVRLLDTLLSFPGWALLSLAMNGVLLVTILAVLRQQAQPPSVGYAPAADTRSAAAPSEPTLRLPRSVWLSAQAVTERPVLTSEPASALKDSHRLTYEEWLALLRQEAQAAAEQNPDPLNILLGDSISLWFPPELLPTRQTWLNQGISGDTTGRLRDRLTILDPVPADKIFVMIGINDLIWGQPDAVILENYRYIVQTLRTRHPNATVIVQSILPHAAENATWSERDRLLALPNRRIRTLNGAIEQIAAEAEATYLNLYPLFADSQGRLRTDFTTDGLHLNAQGYSLWQRAIGHLF
ncbi:MAG: GDSL-type esterase/lipase family protein [Cyanobacteria bacterium P01_D01_bin.128]